MSSPNVQIWTLWTKKYELSNYSEISHVPYFECVYFKSDIGFREFLTEIPKYGCFGSKRYHTSNIPFTLFGKC